MDHSHVINNLFSFAGIGVNDSFEHFALGGGAGPPAVTITGQTYHLICDTEYTDHSIHWFLYNKAEHIQKATQFSAHAFVMQVIVNDLWDINPYVDCLHHFHNILCHRSCLLELQDFTSNSDFAVVMHASNSTSINLWSIVIWCHGNQQPQFINILCHHYEPLHYVLLFPHGEIGWGSSKIPNVPHLSQIDWYCSCLLVNNNGCFSLFGHLTCEYLVDMYS